MGTLLIRAYKNDKTIIVKVMGHVTRSLIPGVLSGYTFTLTMSQQFIWPWEMWK